MTPDDLDMHLIYDVSHNIAKVEEHVMSDGKQKTLLVHRKGATRAFPPHHPLIPVDYQLTGQPVLIGGKRDDDGRVGSDLHDGFRNDGYLQLCSDWHGTRHEGNIRFNVPWSSESRA